MIMTHISGEVLQLGLYSCPCPLSEDVCSLLLCFFCFSHSVSFSTKSSTTNRTPQPWQFSLLLYFFLTLWLPNSREQLFFILHILVRCCSFCYLFHSRAKIHKHVELAFPIVQIIKETYLWNLCCFSMQYFTDKQITGLFHNFSSYFVL